MEFQELKVILKRLFKEYIKKHMKRILIALVLSIIVAASTSGIAWLLDPAVKKIFIEQDKVFAWFIPLIIVIAFSSKGCSLYFARLNIIRVGEEIAGTLQKEVANNILTSDIQTLDNRHSGKYISNIMYDCHHVQNLVGTGVLNLMKDTFSVIALVSVMFYQSWKLALFAILMMPLAGGLAKSLGKRIGKATAKAGVSSGNLASFLTEIFKGSKMIRIYQKEEQENQKADQVISDLVEKVAKASAELDQLKKMKLECMESKEALEIELNEANQTLMARGEKVTRLKDELAQSIAMESSLKLDVESEAYKLEEKTAQYAQLETTLATPHIEGWHYTPSQGWLFTEVGTYPLVFAEQSQSWLYYDQGTSAPWWYFNYSNETWMDWKSE